MLVTDSAAAFGYEIRRSIQQQLAIENAWKLGDGN